MGATVIVNTIGSIIGLDQENGWNQGENWNKIDNIFSWAYSMAGLIAVVFIVKGGIEFMLSQGIRAERRRRKRSYYTR